jgi:hypothetical protein
VYVATRIEPLKNGDRLSDTSTSYHDSS